MFVGTPDLPAVMTIEAVRERAEGRDPRPCNCDWSGACSMCEYAIAARGEIGADLRLALSLLASERAKREEAEREAASRAHGRGARGCGTHEIDEPHIGCARCEEAESAAQRDAALARLRAHDGTAAILGCDETRRRERQAADDRFSSLRSELERLREAAKSLDGYVRAWERSGPAFKPTGDEARTVRRLLAPLLAALDAEEVKP